MVKEKLKVLEEKMLHRVEEEVEKRVKTTDMSGKGVNGKNKKRK